MPGRLFCQAMVPEVTQKEKTKKGEQGWGWYWVIQTSAKLTEGSPASTPYPQGPGVRWGCLWRPFQPRAKAGAGSQLETRPLSSELPAGRVWGVLAFASFAKGRRASVPRAPRAEEVKGWGSPSCGWQQTAFRRPQLPRSRSRSNHRVPPCPVPSEFLGPSCLPWFPLSNHALKTVWSWGPEWSLEPLWDSPSF